MSVTMVHDAWIELLNSFWHNRLGPGERRGRLVDCTWLESYVKRWGLDLKGVPRGGFVVASVTSGILGASSST